MSEDKYVITREKVIDMLYEDRDLARQEGKLSAAITVTKMFGDAIGFFKPAEPAPTQVNNYLRTFTKQDKEFFEEMMADYSKMDSGVRK